MTANNTPQLPSTTLAPIPNSHPDGVPVRGRSPERYVARSMSEAAALIAAGFSGELVSERPFNMCFEPTARTLANRWRRRIATADPNGHCRSREKRYLPNRIIDHM